MNLIQKISRHPILKPLRIIKKSAERYIYLTFGRPAVSAETSKAKNRRLKEDFFEKYCQGKGLDIGFGGDLIVPRCQGWDFEHGDAQTLNGLSDSSFDFVYASHILEHLPDIATSLKNWWRILRQNGYLIIYLPHRDLYEKKKALPSNWNPDHKHFFLIDRDEAPDTIGLVPLLHRTLSNFKLIYAKECKEGHTITDPARHSDGEYSIEAVVQKQ